MKITTRASTPGSRPRMPIASRYCAGVRGCHHVDRVGDARLRGQQRTERRAGCLRSAAAISSPSAAQASAQRIPGPPALVTMPTRRPGGSGWVASSSGDVEHLLERVGADHAGLAEQCVDGHVRRGEQRAGVRRRRPGPRPASARSSPRRSAWSARPRGRCGRTCAGCRTTPGTAGSRRCAGPPPSTGAGRCRRCRPCCRPRRRSRARARASLRVVHDGEPERAALRHEAHAGPRAAAPARTSR